MSEQMTLRPPQAVANELDISSATLRRWADEFSVYLSPEANSGQGRSHRRYTDRDIQTLQTIKELMNDGLTYEQVRQQLTLQFATSEQPMAIPQGYDIDNSNGNVFDPQLGLDEEGVASDENKALMTAADSESPAIAFLTNTLAALSDTQQSILNSQAANRELLGVLIQDNFNLKEENNRLRERILDVERNLAQTRQEEEWRRESVRQELDAKIGSVQQMAAEAMKTAHSVEIPEIKAIKSKPGCLGALFGAGDTQIVTVPRKRARETKATHSAGMPSAAPTQQYPASPAQPAPAHPKPMAPPE